MSATGTFQRLLVRGREVTVRLDESILLSSPQWLRHQTSGRPPAADGCFFGNKGWKLRRWIRPADDDPLRRPGACLVSHGGVQSNAMLALAQLARLRRVRFVYYAAAAAGAVGPGARWTDCSSNLERALALGMELRRLPPAEYALAFGERRRRVTREDVDADADAAGAEHEAERGEPARRPPILAGIALDRIDRTFRMRDGLRRVQC